jgi:hypothetical protein
VLFNKAGDELITYPAGKKGQYAIPTGVTSIGALAFYDCTRLTTVNIPASVTSIEGNPFDGCTSLAGISVDPRNTSYNSHDGVLFNKAGDELITYPAGKKGQYAIPAGVTSIEAAAFWGCTGLTSISIPTSVTSIGEYAFSGCTGSIRIGANVEVETNDDGSDEFNDYYRTNGSKAGVYTFQGGAWSYAER